MAAPVEERHGQLPRIQQLTYGVGHIFNDLCASVWFSYLLIYFHDVIHFDNVLAGYIMLVGQIADALATPFIGFEIDQTNGCCKYGKRKSWHIVGTVCVVVSFPFIFTHCIGCHNSDCWAVFIYYLPFVVIFQFGWAATQISHLSLIPQLTSCQDKRVGLNAIRYTFTVLSNIVVYAITWFLLGVASEGQRELSAADAPKFQILVVTLVSIGAVFTIIFHVGTREDVSRKRKRPALTENGVNAEFEDSTMSMDVMRWSGWLREHQFYQVALIYMCSRLVVNLSQIYLPMFLTSSLNLDKSYIAIIPLVVYVSGFLTSLLMKPFNIYIGRKWTYAIGALMVVGYSAWSWFLTGSTLWQVFGVAVLLGAGSSTLLVTSLTMTADLIGENVCSGAFVYGALSFTDKLSNGIAVLIIQHMHPTSTICKSISCCHACEWFYRNIITFVPAGFALLAILTLLTLAPQRIGRLSRGKRMVTDVVTDVSTERSPLLGDDHQDR